MSYSPKTSPRGARAHPLSSFVADHILARPSTSFSSRDTVVGEWFLPTSTSLKSCCITTVSNLPAGSAVHVSHIPHSDGAGEGKSKLLDIYSLTRPDGNLFLLPYMWMRSHFSGHPISNPCRIRFSCLPHYAVSVYQTGLAVACSSVLSCIPSTICEWPCPPPSPPAPDLRSGAKKSAVEFQRQKPDET